MHDLVHLLQDRGMSLSSTSTPSPRIARSLTVAAGDIPVHTVKIVGFPILWVVRRIFIK